tara:strand:+ start:399 stop:704 length:306 start_codon:yes stop_codon:yes gene_type:complete
MVRQTMSSMGYKSCWYIALDVFVPVLGILHEGYYHNRTAKKDLSNLNKAHNDYDPVFDNEILEACRSDFRKRQALRRDYQILSGLSNISVSGLIGLVNPLY